MLFTAAILAGGGAVLYFVLTISVHSDAAAVPSKAAGVPAEKYSHAVEEARRLGRSLVVEENLPGLSVAVALDGKMVSLVSAVIEAAAGEPFLMFMNREVLARSGMERTVRDEDGGVRDRVSFYFPRAAQRTDLGLQDAPLADYSCFGGTGAFLSTPSDLARFGSAMLKPGLPKAETVALLQAPQRLESGASTGYALGWNVETVKIGGPPTRMVGHRGSSMGGTASFMTFPDLGLVIAATSNVSYASGVAPFGLKVAEAFAKPGEPGT